MGDALTDRVKELSEEAGLRAAVLTGAGTAFSAGGDLEWLLARHADTPENNVRSRTETSDAV